MRVECIHGYFKFIEDAPGQMSDFMSRYGASIARSGDHFTFEFLVDAPTYSLSGGFFLGCPTLFAYAGEPWEVMRANRIVYDFSKNLVVPIDTVIATPEIEAAGDFYMSSGMILPGSLTDAGSRVKDYSAHFSERRQNFIYSEIGYD